MSNSFVKRLETFGCLSSEDKNLLMTLTKKLLTFGKGAEIAKFGAIYDCVYIVLDGIACLSVEKRKGRKQISSLILPGDFHDIYALSGVPADYSLQILSHATLCRFDKADAREALARPAIFRAVALFQAWREANLRRYFTIIARKKSDVKLAYYYADLYHRMNTVGLVKDNTFVSEMTQRDQAETLCLSDVQINRQSKFLREKGLISQEEKSTIFIPNFDLLRKFSDFEEVNVSSSQSALQANRNASVLRYLDL